MFKTTVKLAGVKFPNKDGSSRQEVLGTLFDDYWTEDREDEIKLELRPDPENEYDPNAVAVFLLEPDDLKNYIGYVPADVAATIGTAISEGRVRAAVIGDMGCMRGNHIWAKIEIEMRSEDDSPEDFSEADFFEGEDGHTYRVVG